ncbi:MAG: hypothetical protein J5617_04015 [Bacilli bacterium]|nr:hypothetical protein [Bacilli bacterium]
MAENIIVHSGAKGQKWYVRRYRNYDGTLTEEGRKRYDYYENKTDRVYQTARMKQQAAKTYVKTNRFGVLREDLSKYTNDELKALTNRAKLEKEYREAFNTEQYTRGKKILEGIKYAGREASSFASIGKDLLNNINGIKAALNEAKKAEEREVERLNKQAEKYKDKAEKEKKKVERNANNDAALDYILSIDNPKKRNALIKMLDTISGKGKKGINDYGNITPQMLEKIKKMSKY